MALLVNSEEIRALAIDTMIHALAELAAASSSCPACFRRS